MSINKNNNRTFTFVDLFSGIGGFRIALEKHGGICKGFSEIDRNAIATYKSNFIPRVNFKEIEFGNIQEIKSIPFDVDIIVGGVPCQSWSIAGKMKGFDDPRGKLWNDTLRIVKNSKPKAFIFENVKGLADPRNTKSLDFLVSEFEKLGYTVKTEVLNSYDFGVPQNRERIYIIGIRKQLLTLSNQFKFPLPTSAGHRLHDLIDNLEKVDLKIRKKKLPISTIHKNGKIPYSRNRFQKIDELNDFFIFSDTRNGHSTIHSWDVIKTSDREKMICLIILKNRRKKIYGNSDGNALPFNVLADLIPNLTRDELEKLISKNILRITNKKYEFVNSKNSSGINGVYRIYLPCSNTFSTLTATVTKDFIALKNVTGNDADDFKNNFISEIFNKKKYRHISSAEAARLQGFPINFKVHPTNSVAQKQFGNAVSVPVIESLINSIKQTGIF